MTATFCFSPDPFDLSKPPSRVSAGLYVGVVPVFVALTGRAMLGEWFTVRGILVVGLVGVLAATAFILWGTRQKEGEPPEVASILLFVAAGVLLVLRIFGGMIGRLISGGD
jgi:hypothetical protein